MERDAFKLLLAKPQKGQTQQRSKHAQQARRKPHSSPVASPSRGSRFVECPLCGKSVHSSLVTKHVEHCISSAAAPDEDAPPLPNLINSNAEKSGLRGPPPDMASSQDQKGESRADEKHAAAAAEAAAAAAAEGETAIGEPTASKAASSINPAKKAAAVRSPSRHPPPRPGSRNSDGKIVTTAANAFSTLMAASALANFREEIYLWAHDDLTLSWGWGASGNPLPAPPGLAVAGGSSGSDPNESRRWSCQVATKGPDGRQAGTCEVWTNLAPAAPLPGPPAAEAAEGQGQARIGGRAATAGTRPAGDGENVGLKAARPGQSLSRLPLGVVKSMLQKNIRRGRAEAAVRCALELSLRSWSDAVRRLLVIIVEDSLLHPAAPFLTWLMVATSKGYRPPPRLLSAFLSVVHETAACPVRDSTESCRRRFRNRRFPKSQDHRSTGSRPSGTAANQEQESEQHWPVTMKSFNADEFPIPHPRSLLLPSASGSDGGAKIAAADAAVANIRRALLLRVSYGGMAFDQALLKGACLAWGERCGHYQGCSCCGGSRCSSTSAPAPAGTTSHSCDDCCGSRDAPYPNGGDDAPGLRTGVGTDLEHESASDDAPLPTRQLPPPDPPRYVKHRSRPGIYFLRLKFEGAGNGGVAPFGYAHASVVAALEGNEWTAFVAAAHGGTGMPPALLSQLMAHVAGCYGSVADGAPGERAIGERWRPAGRKGEGRRDGRAEEPSRDAKQGEPPLGGPTARNEGATDDRTRLGPIIRETDAILSGVDFHCSGVLDELLRSTTVAARIGEAIHLHENAYKKRKAGSQTPAAADSALPAGEVGREDDAEEGLGHAQAVSTGATEAVGVRSAAKQAMWACSGSLNVRKLRVAFSPGSQNDGDQSVESNPMGCCSGCWSSPGFVEEIQGVEAGPDETDYILPRVGEDGSSPDLHARVWAAMYSDVFGWTRRFVRARLARG